MQAIERIGTQITYGQLLMSMAQVSGHSSETALHVITCAALTHAVRYDVRNMSRVNAQNGRGECRDAMRSRVVLLLKARSS